MRLRTSDRHRPGWRRVRHGRGFRYLDQDGRPLDAERKQRVKDLVIPPAWTDVWICPWPNGHLQAVGTDAAGRRQYLYHPDFRARQEQAKHAHVREVAAALPRLRERTEAGLREHGLTRGRVLSCAVRLLDLGFFRVGSAGYSLDNGTYGLTTMLREHTECRRGEVRFSYPAKGAKHMVRAVADEQTCATVRALLRRAGDGEELFAYWEGRAWHTVDSAALNACLRDFSGADITAKDFRTWHATVLAAVALAVSWPVACRSRTGRRKAVARAVQEVSHYLGNTPAVCRASYIDPRVIELFEEGHTVAADLDRLGEGTDFGRPATQGAVERAVLALLRDGAGR
ncbi:DNA topoisomerase IB [Actinacidiphila alni]|uniref:DNA topoisomerase IB n=1 Tax=Actinacidiphila alni TaxID=380248 RepID=UPI0033D60343